jgi:plastocyanin
MRRPLLASSLVVIALLVSACASASGPGWTYAPPTQPPSAAPAASGQSAAPSDAGSAAPSNGNASASPSGGSSAAPSGGASGAPSGGGQAVQISASNIAFEQPAATAPAGAAFTIHFNNKDAGVPHNVAIKDAGGTQVFKGDIVTGPKETDYSVPALTAGTYQFVCDVHPNMTGTLTVGG